MEVVVVTVVVVAVVVDGEKDVADGRDVSAVVSTNVVVDSDLAASVATTDVCLEDVVTPGGVFVVGSKVVVGDTPAVVGSAAVVASTVVPIMYAKIGT